ncbi:MAG: hypothetical protein LQ351_003197 [Letrouitia transgressa]|nr:MAG: hypothetical protein LQ351_003197 [Letrouitia transgressa]
MPLNATKTIKRDDERTLREIGGLDKDDWLNCSHGKGITALAFSARRLTHGVWIVRPHDQGLGEDDLDKRSRKELIESSTSALVKIFISNSNDNRLYIRFNTQLKLQEPTYDLIAIINANQVKTNILVDLAPRVKLLLGGTDIKAIIKRLMTTVQSDAFPKAVKLAKAFRHIRTFASSLYLVITDGFREECHESHETRLFLEDRVDLAAEILHRVGKANSTNHLMMFELVFTAGSHPKEQVYYETDVQVFDEDDCDGTLKFSLDNFTRHDSRADTLIGLSFVSPRPPSPSKPAIALIASICAAITEAGTSKRRISFALVGNQPIGAISDDAPLAHRLQEESSDAISLKKILQDVVFFLVRPGAQGQVLLNRPFVRCAFGGTHTAPCSIEPKMALLELGILLLEIWHKTTLEARFGLEHAPTAYYDRMARGLEWLDDVDEPLPDLYDKAVAHCLRVNVSGGTRLLHWDDA